MLDQTQRTRSGQARDCRDASDLSPQLRIKLSPETVAVLKGACVRAGERETGGMLFGEHITKGDFVVVEATVEAVGLFASFVRAIKDGFAKLENFFRRTRYDFTRFNYLGEWHSHPSFALIPSSTDSATMQAIVEEPSTGALFLVLLIVKLEENELRAGAWAYFPGSPRQTCVVTLE